MTQSYSEHRSLFPRTFVSPPKLIPDVDMKPDSKDQALSKDRLVCFYCKKSGHTINNCFWLNKTVKLLKTDKVSSEETLSSQLSLLKFNIHLFSPFMTATYSLTDGDYKVPVTILRDTTASLLLILEGVLPLSEKSSVQLDVLV